MTPTQKILSLALLLTATAAGLATLLLAAAHPPGVLAQITNTGTTPLRDLRLHVTGRSYPLGDLPPGASRSARVNPLGESSLNLTYTDPAGAPQSLSAGGYFESGYTGQITVDVTDGQVTRVKDETTLPYH